MRCSSPKDFRFDEDPVRLVIEREKTDEPIETFIDKDTAEAFKQLITRDNIQPDEHTFIQGEYKNSKVGSLRNLYNIVVARAGYGKVIKCGNTCYAIPDKKDGHVFGKYPRY